jgi:hypothetical protein
MKKHLLIVLGGIVVLGLAGGGLYVALQKDHQLCEELSAKGFLVERVDLDRTHNEYHVYLGGVINRGAQLTEWEATYDGQTFRSGEEGEGRLVSQFGKETDRAGFLGSDLKRLYGGNYKHYTFKFFIKWLDDQPRPLTIKGKITDPLANKEIPFTCQVDLKAP